MKKVTAQVETQETAPAEVHFMRKHRTLISTKSLDYENLSAFESVTMAAAFVLAVLVGTISATIA